MAKRIAKCNTLTPTAYADAAAAANSTYFFTLRGGAATAVSKVWEVVVSGLAAAASSPMELPLALASTLSVGALTAGTGFTEAPLDPATAALATPTPVGNSAATSGPARSATFQSLDCSFNAYGGKYKWTAYDESFCPSILGNATVNQSEISLALRAGTPGAMSAHMIYETK